MATVAEQLRQTREAQNLTIYQVAEQTKIKTDHIRALEDGNYDRFTAPVYIRGFVRTYATMLKLPVPALLSELDLELRKTEKFADPPTLLPVKKGPLDFVMLYLTRLNWRVASVVLGLLVIFLLAVTGFRNWRQRPVTDPLRKMGPALYHPSNEAFTDVLPLPEAAPAPRR